MKKILLIGMMISSLTCFAKSSPTEKDILSSAESGDWKTALGLAYKVPATERGPLWKKSVRVSIEKMMDHMAKDQKDIVNIQILSIVFDFYHPFLDDKSIQSKLVKVTLPMIQNCRKGNWRSGWDQFCSSFFIEHFQKLPEDSKYLFEIGKSVRKSSGNFDSLKFFEKSLALKNTETRCDDKDVLVANEWAMNRSPLDKAAQKIVFSHCWKSYREDLVEETTSASGYYLENLCINVKRKKISLPASHKCS